MGLAGSMRTVSRIEEFQNKRRKARYGYVQPVVVDHQKLDTLFQIWDQRPALQVHKSGTVGLLACRGSLLLHQCCRTNSLQLFQRRPAPFQVY